MNIDLDKAVTELVWATLDGRVARAAAEPGDDLRSLFAKLLIENRTRHELDRQNSPEEP